MDTAKRTFTFDTGAAWALGITLALAAIAFIPSTSIPFLYTKASLLAVGAIVTLALFILARLTRGNIIIPSSFLLGALWLVPAAYALSSLFSGAGLKNAFFGTELETDTFGFVLLAALLATLAALVLRRREQLRAFYLTLAATGIIVVLAEIFFLIAGQVAPATYAATTNLIGSFEDLGIMMGLLVVTAMLALRFLTLPSRIRIGLIIAGAIGLFCLALVNSFLVWVMVGLAALGLFIEAIMRRGMLSGDEDLEGVTTPMAFSGESADDSPRSLVAPLIVLVIALFFLIGGATVGNALSGSLHASTLDVRPSWTATFGVGGHTYASSPVFGTGPNSFTAEWLKFRDASINDTVFWSIDFTSGIGYVPTSFVTTGAVGAIAWVAFFALMLFFGIRFLITRSPQDPFVRFVALSSFVGVVYLFGLAIFTVPGPVVLAFAFVLAGVFISSMRYGADAREWGVAFNRSPRVGFLIVFLLTLLLLGSVLGVYVVTERYLASVSYNQALSALNNGDVAGAKAAIARSIVFAPSARAYRLSSTIGLAHLNQIAADTTASPDAARTDFQTTLSSAVSDALTATQLGSNDYQNWAALGTVYASVVPLGIDGAYDNAKTAYAHAAQLSPTNPVIPYVLAQLEIANKNGAAAEADLTQAITLKHDYTDAIFLLSQLEVQLGKAKEALQAAEAAAYFAPNDPTVLFQVGLLRLGTGDVDGAIAALTGATKANPQYANAHYFLAAALAQKKDYADAEKELQAVADLSADNAKAVQAAIDALKAGKNPFPATTFATRPVAEPTTPAAAATPTAPAQ
jgi:tetratricopeptide (TPR) repeat protein